MDSIWRCQNVENEKQAISPLWTLFFLYVRHKKSEDRQEHQMINYDIAGRENIECMQHHNEKMNRVKLKFMNSYY